MILGVDPGLDGGLALLGADGLQVERIPVIEAARRDIYVLALADLIKGWHPQIAYVERVHAMPKQGVTSSFRFGEVAGIIRGVIVALGIPLTYCTPQEWQKEMLAGAAKGDKGVAMRRAVELWPDVDFKATARCKLPHSGMCDAALIAEFGRRRSS